MAVRRLGGSLAEELWRVAGLVADFVYAPIVLGGKTQDPENTRNGECGEQSHPLHSQIPRPPGMKWVDCCSQQWRPGLPHLNSADCGFLWLAWLIRGGSCVL